MRSRLLVALTATITMAAASVVAETIKGALGVSATVVRSCRVSTDAPSVRVECGTRPHPVQIAPSTPAEGTDRRTTRSITIEF
jgi:hypothetical protein